jgi:hypothetical protein
MLLQKDCRYFKFLTVTLELIESLNFLNYLLYNILRLRKVLTLLHN